MTSPFLLVSVTRGLLSPRIYFRGAHAHVRGRTTRHALRADDRDSTLRRPGSSRTRPFLYPCWKKRVIVPLDKLGDASERDFATGLGFFTVNCCHCDITMLRHVYVSRFAALIDISAGIILLSRFYRSAFLFLCLASER